MSIEKIVDSAKHFIKNHKNLIAAVVSIASLTYPVLEWGDAIKKHPDLIKMMAANMIGKTLYRDIQVNYTPEYGIKTIVPKNMPDLGAIDKRYRAVTECLGLDAELYKDSFEVLIYGDVKAEPLCSDKESETFGYAFYSPLDRSYVLVVNGDLSALGHEMVHYLANVTDENSELLARCGDDIDESRNKARIK